MKFLLTQNASGYCVSAELHSLLTINSIDSKDSSQHDRILQSNQPNSVTESTNQISQKMQDISAQQSEAEAKCDSLAQDDTINRIDSQQPKNIAESTESKKSQDVEYEREQSEAEPSGIYFREGDTINGIEPNLTLFSHIFLSQYEQNAFLQKVHKALKRGKIPQNIIEHFLATIATNQNLIIERFLPLAESKVRECNNTLAIFIPHEAYVPANKKVQMLLSQLAEIREDIEREWEKMLRKCLEDYAIPLSILDFTNTKIVLIQQNNTNKEEQDPGKSTEKSECQNGKQQNDAGGTQAQDDENQEDADDEGDEDEYDDEDSEYESLVASGQIAKHRYNNFERYRTKLHQKSLKELSRILGNMFALKSSGEEKSIEKSGITFGRDLANVLPSELVYLDDATSMLFELKYMQNNLACFAPKISQGKERGAMILALDASGSMSGKPWEITRAIAAFLGGQAIAQKRPLYLIYFDTSITTLEVQGAKDSKALEKFLSINADGGTDVEPAIDEAVAKVRQKAFKNADILVVSDFILNNYRGAESALKQLPQGNKAYALTIDSRSFNHAHAKGAIQSHFHAQYVLNPQNNQIIKLGEKNKKAQKRL